MQNVLQMSGEARSIFEAIKERQFPKLVGRCAPRDADIFWLRFERYFEDFYHPLTELYGDRPDYTQQIEALFEQMVEAYIARPEPLRLLDLEREFTPDWFEHSNMIGYVCYGDLFAGTLQGVREKVSYLEELGITYLHLMSILKPRPAPNDGGYALMDYQTIDPELGTMEDLRELATDLREKGISLCVDLVLNHTAKEHEWAQRAMAGEEKYLEYYYTFSDRTLPDVYEKTLPEIFPDDAPGNFTWYPEMAGSGRWVWTTFMEYQWDLNYTNINVFREMMDIMFFLVNQGVDILRLDAAPFIWKRLETNCQNQPEVFKLIQVFRGLMRVIAPAVIFKAEAIVPPNLLQQYIGIKATTGKQCKLAYNNQLMVDLWSGLATHKATLLSYVSHKHAPLLFIGATTVNYIRNHDDIGWGMGDEDLHDIGEEPFLHRQFLNQFYTGNFPGSFAKGELFQFNPVTKDARISGTTSSLAGLEVALENHDEPAIDLAIRRLLLLHSIALFARGIPLIYMGDEVGLLNDYTYINDPNKAKDSRWLHRPKMDWSKVEKRHDPDSIEGRIYQGLLHLIKIRKSTSLLHSFAFLHPMWTDNDHVWAISHKRPEGSILMLANFDDHWQSVNTNIIYSNGFIHNVRNLLAPGVSLNIAEGRLYLAPYECVWLVGDE
ncbi:alpha amylase catalytic region [Gloeothece citriformis PCC 7424]|uniref:Alpha amylase catalytic region n=1 Tax=Gloeothece citriformis (strain PCC 7424) TaxID=65393 RepID=B7KGQ1_GLOC7|nr:alpha-amylase family protein [Gloeothece citriformis]ACK71978.1 alpha amylase catalytic region [Gloeothece citriformis PCC 7424]